MVYVNQPGFPIGMGTPKLGLRCLYDFDGAVLQSCILALARSLLW